MDAGWRVVVLGVGERWRRAQRSTTVATLQALEFAAAVRDMYSDNLGACGRLAGTRGSAGLVAGSRCSVGRQILRR
jgi:hypothetical protein